MKNEMDFFLEHFIGEYYPEVGLTGHIGAEIHGLVENILSHPVFAHRDFHSRNMLIHHDVISLVDIQDSLQGPEFYDLVSFAYDSYLRLHPFHDHLFGCLENLGLDLDESQIGLTALQRNIKALGTFGFQVRVKKNLKYKEYIQSTIQHIRSNRMSAEYTPRLLSLFD
jgi:aminoglycoside/choline kinase family phosphotransferase